MKVGKLSKVIDAWWEGSGNYQTPNGSMYCIDEQIFSYGTHFCIAYYDREINVVFFTERVDSRTTARHKALVLRKISGAKIVMCNRPEYVHYANSSNAEYFIAKIRNYQNDILESFNSKKYIPLIKQEARKYMEYITVLDMNLPKIHEEILGIHKFILHQTA